MIWVYILIAIAVVLIGLIAFIAMQPGDFRITRSASMAAPPAKVFGEVNDFHQWGAWSPWEKMDPNMKKTYEGPAPGVGAITRWEGNKQVGQGAMTILESKPNDLIRIKLEFLKPFQATNTAEFIFRPEGQGTKVEWSMIGTKNFMFKAFGLLMNMDKLVGNDFEKGLAAMKGIVEAKG